ncbi:MAG TPA: site-2 protease family protein [Kofleriaceae bacterium]|nr:site-2 protease family protein [Kofleriaceae bacterium]
MKPSSPALKNRPRRQAIGGVRIGRVLGVDLAVDWSLLIIFALIAISLGAGVLPAWHPEWSGWLTWLIALAASVLFFGSVFLHELSHAVVANRLGIPVHRITLFIFGGMAHMESEPPSARSELAMAIVGPITSIVIGVVATFIGAAMASGALSAATVETAASHVGPVATLLLWLGPINLLLGVFNLIPGFPLDGGRVLRSILWGATGDLVKATRWAANVGRGFAWLLIALGVLMLFGATVPILGGGVVSGLWLILIGWFLNNAARVSYEQVVMSEALENVVVADIMRTRTIAVDPHMTVDELVRDYIMRTDQRAFPVIDGDRLVGLVCLEDTRRASHREWRNVTVAQVMTPATKLVTMAPNDEAASALKTLADREVNQIPVVDGGRLCGLVRREDVMKWLAVRG